MRTPELYEIREITKEKVADLLHNGFEINYIYTIKSIRENREKIVHINCDLYIQFVGEWVDFGIYDKCRYNNEIRNYIVAELSKMV